MAKTKIRYVCQHCGKAAPKPLGRCPQCGSWNSMVAEAPRREGRARRPGFRAEPRLLRDIDLQAEGRQPLSIEEFSRVLGGGVVPGSVVLIGGDPGIGKSTLMLQVAADMAREARVLYVSGEESLPQIKSRAGRLEGLDSGAGGIYLLSETDLDAVLEHVGSLRPRLLVVDSIQTMHLAEVGAGPGSVSQVRECAARLQEIAKTSGVAVFLVGHVTKEGALAGPRVLEHIVDTVLYLEGDRFHAFRLLRAVKNRFGPTSEVGVFEMHARGMVEVPNPSEVFLAERAVDAPGSAVAVTMEGSRPLLVEIQGLTSPTSFGHPRRTANGVDLNRLLLTIAVLARRVGLRLADQDVFVNVVGGLRVDEPAADLAMAAALASSVWDRPVPSHVILVGEVGLSGELRPVPRLQARLREAEKLGFQAAVIPPGGRRENRPPQGLDILEARSLRAALERVLSDDPPGGGGAEMSPMGGGGPELG